VSAVPPALPAPSPDPSESFRARLQTWGEAVGNQRHLLAVRDGVIGALPLVLVGSFFLLLAQPPSARLQAWVAPYAATLLLPYRMLGGLIGLYVTFGTAHALAKTYRLDAPAAGLVALASYLVAAMPAGLAGPPALPLARVGPGGLFAGLLIAILSVELTRLLAQGRLTLRLPSSAPEVVVRSFAALIPCFLSVVGTFLLVHVLRVDLVSLLEALAAPLLGATGSLAAVLTIVGLDSGLWLLGVHAAAITAPIRPLWEAMLVQNMEAVVHGAAPLHIATQPFYLWFVWQGGSGALLALALLLVFARSAQLKSVGRLGLLPALCNVNEPLLFGVPVVLNPALALPFVVAPLVCGAVAYAACALHFVRPPYLEVPWTLPAPLGALLATGGDWRALLLELGNLALAMGIYWPFLRRYDARLLAEEASAAQATASPGAESL
jgi:PTS system cellobiose-specific IIC component